MGTINVFELLHRVCFSGENRNMGLCLICWLFRSFVAFGFCFYFYAGYEIVLRACRSRCAVRMLCSYNAIVLLAIVYKNLLSKSVSWQAAKRS